MKTNFRQIAICLIMSFAFIFSSNAAFAKIVTQSWQTPAPPLNDIPCTYYNVVKFYWSGEPFNSTLLKVEQTRTRSCTQALVVETDLTPIYNSNNEITGFTVDTSTCNDADPNDGIDGCADLASTENLNLVYLYYTNQ